MREYKVTPWSDIEAHTLELIAEDPEADPINGCEFLCKAVEALEALQVPLIVHYENIGGDGPLPKEVLEGGDATPIPREVTEQLWGQSFGKRMIVFYRGEDWLIAATTGCSTQLLGDELDFGDIIPEGFEFADVAMVPLRLLNLDE